MQVIKKKKKKRLLKTDLPNYPKLLVGDAWLCSQVQMSMIHHSPPLAKCQAKPSMTAYTIFQK